MQPPRGRLLVLCCALTLALASSRQASAQCSRGGTPGGRQLIGGPRPGLTGGPCLPRTASPLQRQLLLIALQQRALQGFPAQGQPTGLFLQQENQVVLRLLDRIEDESDEVIAQALRSPNAYLRKAAAIENARRKAEKRRVAERKGQPALR